MRTARMLLAVVGCVFVIAAPLAAQVTPGAPPAQPAAQGESPSARGPDPLLRKVSLDLRDVPLGDALKEINRQAHLGLAYSPQIVPLDRRVTIKADNITAGAALQRVLEGTGVQVHVGSTGTVFLVASEASPEPSTPQRHRDFGGYVTDSATHQPLSGVQIFVRNTPFSAVTNEAGIYIIRDVPPGRYTVTARLIGYTPVSATVTVTDSAKVELSFTLRQSPTRLTELVTTATGPRRRVELGNDITIIDADSVVRTQPVSSVTDLLEGRVPGLVVQRTTGAPGDPGRLRLRGTSGVLTNNDPIVIVDGVRVYSQQSNVRSANLTGGFAAPSPIDQIDPHSIETIEVLKGPSAATLYGADAANGVIVITTKKGRAGPAHWSVSVDRGTSYMGGAYPDSYLRFGHRPGNGTSVICPLTDSYDGSGQHLVPSACVTDSVVRFQALNDPDLTVLDRGASTAATVGVTGGGEAVQYSVTASYHDELGLVRLPSLEADRYRLSHDGVAAPEWMLRPQQYTQWGVSSRLTAKLSNKADVAVTTALNRGKQQHSTLEEQLLGLMGTYIDRTTGRYYTPDGFGTGLQTVEDALTNYYTRVTDNSTTFTNGLNFNWRALSWLTASADAGINVIQREDASLLPHGAMLVAGDSGGRAAAGKGTSVVGTVNLRATSTVPLGLGFRLQTAVGANYTDQRTADVVIAGSNLTPGGTSVATAATILNVSDHEVQQATFGWYVEPTLAQKRFWLSLGLRFDGGTSFGANAPLFALPKISPSWLISDEPWFPFKSVFNTLRLRAAYGKAGVQPGPTDRLRLFNTPVSDWVDGQVGSTTTLKTFGNTQIRPERSTEFEGGFDADLLADRLSLSVTGYRKTRDDALLKVPVPPSVYGGGLILKNVGVIRNTGFEMTLGSQVLRSNLVTWGMLLTLSHNNNMVVSLAPGVDPFFTDLTSGARVVPGYPLNGKWAKPIVGYDDLNGDGILASNEVVYGDSLVYMGPSEPDYTAHMSTTLSLFRGAVSLSADFDLQRGLTQTGSFAQLVASSRGMNDPTAPLSEQAAVISAMGGRGDFLNTQTVSMLRFNSLSVAYNVPGRVARRLGARALSVALQGTNLGLFTNYRGKDPGVNGAVTGDLVIDTGVLPQPRTWQLRVSASY